MSQTIRQKQALRSYLIKNGIAHEVGVHDPQHEDAIAAFKGLVVAIKFLMVGVVVTAVFMGVV